MKKLAKSIIGIIFSFEMAFFVFWIVLIILLIVSARSCTDDVKKRGLKNILNNAVEEYWEGDSTKVDSTK
jgi:hypothetical protein